MRLVIEHLTKVYPSGVVALDDLSMDVHTGELVVLLGPNGAGKTTLIHCVLGLVKPDRGRITLDDLDVLADPRVAHDRIAVVFEEASNTYAYMTVEENLRYFGHLNAIPRSLLRDEIERLLDQFGLEGLRRAPVQTLSRGMKQKLALAAGFLKSTPFLFLDEPTLGLDVEARGHIVTLLRDRRDHRGILLTTHDMHLAFALGERFFLMHKGRLVWSGDRRTLEGTGIWGGEDLEDLVLSLAGSQHRCGEPR